MTSSEKIHELLPIGKSVESDWESNGEASAADLAAVSRHIGRELPLDYVTFMKRCDGGEGFVGDGFIRIWRAGQLIKYNQDYEVEKYVLGMLFFGSDGGGEAFAFDLLTEDMSIVSIPFIGMDRKDAVLVGRSMLDLFRYIIEPADEK